MNYSKIIEDIIDRHRREICQRLKTSKGEVSEMYYEGMIQGLTMAQNIAKEFARIQ